MTASCIKVRRVKCCPVFCLHQNTTQHYLTRIIIWLAVKKAKQVSFIPKLIKMQLEGHNAMPFHISGKPYFFTEEPSSTSSFIFHIIHYKSSLHSIIMSDTLTGKHLNTEFSVTPSGDKLLSKLVVRTCVKVVTSEELILLLGFSRCPLTYAQEGYAAINRKESSGLPT